MAKIQVRNFPDEIFMRVEAAAARAERSIEAECRLALIEKYRPAQEESLTHRQKWRKDVAARLAFLFERLRSDGFFAWDEPSDVAHIARRAGEASPALLFDCFDGLDDLSFELADRLSDSFGFNQKWLLSGDSTPFPAYNIGSSYHDFFAQPEEGKFSWELYRVSGGRHDGELICLKVDNDSGNKTLGYICEHFVLADGMGGGGRGNLESFIEFLKVNWHKFSSCITTWIYEAGSKGTDFGQHHPIFYQRLMSRSSGKWLTDIFEGRRPGEWLKEFDYELNDIKKLPYGRKDEKVNG
ncbi:hypothetical protein LQK91_21340 [Pantoea sp. MHSD4]|uniref:FitA-like ribbon-helix-helix domain-containing protein n=1 Tax=Pantoea sp. MHSD4 TaxID=2898077 RepID=UPI0011B81148|nr:hypothetical protein [Pantoea sp. MHSD4]MCD2358949.1 hypothetical protein [Pantoea sp. MHSD4]